MRKIGDTSLILSIIWRVGRVGRDEYVVIKEWK